MYKPLIKEYRKKRKLSQGSLAELSGVSKSYISELENRKHDPTIVVIIQLCLALEISPNELLNWDMIKEYKLKELKINLNNM